MSSLGFGPRPSRSGDTRHWRSIQEKQFYSRQTSEEDFSSQDTLEKLRLERRALEERIERLETTVVDERISRARLKATQLNAIGVYQTIPKRSNNSAKISRN